VLAGRVRLALPDIEARFGMHPQDARPAKALEAFEGGSAGR
jgi:hypothetical protein